MEAVLVRLSDLSKDGYRILKEMCEEPKLPRQHSRFLTGDAMKLENMKACGTYLLTDRCLKEIYGYFAISAGVRCAYDRPVFEIGRLYGKDTETEKALIGYAESIVRAFGDAVGPAVLTARCNEKQIWVFADSGFTFTETVPGGHVRMRYGGLMQTEAAEGSPSLPDCRGPMLCRTISSHC